MPPKKPVKKNIAEKQPVNRSKPKSTEPGLFTKIIHFIKDEKLRFILGILLALAVLYALLSFVSYFFTGAADKSVFDNISFRDSLQIRSSVQNWTSVMGAYISETLIDNWFGVSAFTILIFLFIAALRLMKVKLVSIWKAFFHLFFWLIWTSVTLGYLTDFLPSLQPSFFAFNFSISWLEAAMRSSI